MGQPHGHIREKFSDMPCKMLSTIHRPMLSSGASEGNHKTVEPPFRICPHMWHDHRIDMFKETDDLSIILEKTYDRFITSGQFLIRFISARIMNGTAVKHVSASVSCRILRYSFLEREAADLDFQAPLLNMVIMETRQGNHFLKN